MKRIFFSSLMFISVGAQAGFVDEFKEAWRIDGNDYGASTATDSTSNLYIAGSKSGGGLFSTSDLMLTKYRANGNEIWTRNYGTPDDDQSSSVTTDTAGNIYLTGKTYGSFDGHTNAGEYDVFVSKFDAQGKALWTQQFGTDGDNISRAITADNEGNVYLTGVFLQPEPSLDSDENPQDEAFISKLSPEGSVLWTHSFGTSAGDGGYSISTDSHNNVYIIGRTLGAFEGFTNQGDFDIFITKFTAEGEQVWNRQIGSSSADFANSIDTDSNGNIYLAGAMDGNLFTARYDEQGNLIWIQQDNQRIKPGSGSINLGSDGHAYVGYSYSERCQRTAEICSDRGFVSHFYLRKYSADGEKLWDQGFVSSAFINGESVTIDPAQRITLAVNISHMGFRYSSKIIRIEPETPSLTISDRFNPLVTLAPFENGFTGQAGDSEDLNLNGVLDDGEDINNNSIIDFRSEDTNNDGVLSDNEDENGNGLLDSDTGIASIVLKEDATNLSLTVTPFVAGSLQTSFTLSLIHPNIDGNGTLLVSDIAGNQVTQEINLTAIPAPINQCSTASNYATHAGDERIELSHWATSQNDPGTDTPEHAMWITGNNNPDLFAEQPWVSYPSWSLYFQTKPGASGTATITYSVVDYATGGKQYTCGEESFHITVAAPGEETLPATPVQVPKNTSIKRIRDSLLELGSLPDTPIENQFNEVKGEISTSRPNTKNGETSGGGGMGMMLLAIFFIRAKRASIKP